MIERVAFNADDSLVAQLSITHKKFAAPVARFL